MVEHLTTAVKDLGTKVERLRKAFDRRTLVGVVLVLLLVAAMTAAVLLAVRTQTENERVQGQIRQTQAELKRTQAEIDRRVRESERRWCPLVTLSLKPAAEPTTKRGQELLELTKQLARDFHCATGG